MKTNKIIIFLFLAIMFSSFINAKKNKSTNVEQRTIETSTKYHETQVWLFYKISDSAIINNKTSRSDVFNKFKDTDIEINDKLIKIVNLCGFEPAINTRSIDDYWMSKKTANFYREFLSREDVQLGDSIDVFESIYPDKACSPPYDEFYIADNTLIINSDGYLIFFKKKNDACFLNEKRKITEEPAVDCKMCSLPFDYGKYSNWQEQVDESEIDDDGSYPNYPLSDNKSLSNIYENRWNTDTIPQAYYILNTHTANFKTYLFWCNLKNGTPSIIYRIVTIADGNVIDGLTLYSSVENRKCETISFTISKTLDIRLFGIKNKEVAKYQIQDDGKIVKIK